MTQPLPHPELDYLRFEQLDRRQVVADFSGGQITSDGGLILVAQLDQHDRISARVAACFADQRIERSSTSRRK